MYSFGYFPGVRLWLYFILYIQPLKMELIEGSGTSANHNRTPGKYPKEYILVQCSFRRYAGNMFIWRKEHACRQTQPQLLPVYNAISLPASLLCPRLISAKSHQGIPANSVRPTILFARCGLNVSGYNPWPSHFKVLCLRVWGQNYVGNNDNANSQDSSFDVRVFKLA